MRNFLLHSIVSGIRGTTIFILLTAFFALWCFKVIAFYEMVSVSIEITEILFMLSYEFGVFPFSYFQRNYVFSTAFLPPPFL